MTANTQAAIAKQATQWHQQHYPRILGLIRSVFESASGPISDAQFWICLNLSESLISGGETEHIVFQIGNASSPRRYNSEKNCCVCRGLPDDNDAEHLQLQHPKHSRNRFRAGLPQGATAFPICYQRKPLGVLASTDVSPDSKDVADACKSLARDIAYQIKRYEFSILTKEKFGKGLIIVGATQNMKAQDRFIERVSQVDLPVVIVGEQGCEREHVAYALHLGGARHDKPFVSVDCLALDTEEFEEKLLDSFEKAGEGTIFFNDIDELSYKAQSRLAEILSSRAAQSNSAMAQEHSADVRVIASTSRNLTEMAAEKKFYKPLLKELDFLNTRIDPLRERSGDIKPLIDCFLEKYRDHRDRSISNEVLSLFEAYSWPGNVYEIERVIARLVVMGNEEVISLDDVFAFAPHLICEPRNLTRGKTAERSQKGVNGRLIDQKVLNLVNHLLNGQHVEIRSFHTGIQKALKYLADNFHEDISLPVLAQQACLSPSHLCFLLQKTVGVNFKTLLAIIRIQKAKELLIEKPNMRITEISGEVGFGELSHFERTFKLIAHCTPREYRQIAMKQ